MFNYILYMWLNTVFVVILFFKDINQETNI